MNKAVKNIKKVLFAIEIGFRTFLSIRKIQRKKYIKPNENFNKTLKELINVLNVVEKEVE